MLGSWIYFILVANHSGGIPQKTNMLLGFKFSQSWGFSFSLFFKLLSPESTQLGQRLEVWLPMKSLNPSHKISVFCHLSHWNSKYNSRLFPDFCMYLLLVSFIWMRHKDLSQMDQLGQESNEENVGDFCFFPKLCFNSITACRLLTQGLFVEGLICARRLVRSGKHRSK